jgi:hypothetical protein
MHAFIHNHALKDENFYSSLDGTFIDASCPLWALPNPSSPPFVSFDFPLNTPLEFGWIHPRYVFLSLIPVPDRQWLRDVPLLHCLSKFSPVSEDKLIGFSRSQRVHVFDRKLKDSWMAVEKTLCDFVRAIEDILSLPADERLVPTPSLMGYARTHISHEAAVYAVKGAYHTFFFLLGRATFCLLLVQRSTGWRERIVEFGISEDDVAHVEASLGNLTVPRLGGVLSMASTPLDTLLLLRGVNAPFYLHWGRDPGIHASVDGTFRPDAACMEQLQQAALPLLPRTVSSDGWGAATWDAPMETYTFTTPAATSSVPSVTAPPGLKMTTKQLEGEHWRSYFERQKAANTIRQMNEDKKAQQSRLAKEAHARTGLLPSSKKTNTQVFYWEEGCDGTRTRIKLVKGEWGRYWSSAYNRRYNGFTDQYDICSEFDADDCISHTLDNDSDEDGEDKLLPLPPEPPRPPTLAGLEARAIRPTDWSNPAANRPGSAPASSDDFLHPQGQDIASTTKPCLPSSSQDSRWATEVGNLHPESEDPSPAVTSDQSIMMVDIEPCLVVGLQDGRQVTEVGALQMVPQHSNPVVLSNQNIMAVDIEPRLAISLQDRRQDTEVGVLQVSEDAHLAAASDQNSMMVDISPLGFQDESPYAEMNVMGVDPQDSSPAAALLRQSHEDHAFHEDDKHSDPAHNGDDEPWPDHELPASRLAVLKYGFDYSKPLPSANNFGGRILNRGYLGLDQSDDSYSHEDPLLEPRFGPLVKCKDLLLGEWLAEASEVTDIITICSHPLLKHYSNYGASNRSEGVLWVTTCEDRDFSKKLVYFIRTSESGNLALMIESGLVVCEILRRGWASLGLPAIAQELSRRAIRFKPCFRKPKDAPISPPSQEMPSDLGYRAYGYCPNAIDLQTYESIRKEFFRGPRGQLALYHGGYVARMALDDIELDVARLLPELTTDSRQLCDYWWNELTSHELSLIAGCYSVHTGMYLSYRCLVGL